MLAVGRSVLDCAHFDADRCRSCSWLGQPYDNQVLAKEQAARDLVRAVLDGRPEPEWLPPVLSRPDGFRSKAKMVVTGTADEPRLGIWDPRRGGVDLRDCALHTPGIVAALPVLAGFVSRAGLAPYDVPGRSGELKHVLVTESPDGELMVRWVLRSTEAETRIRKHLPALLAELPSLRVVTLNIQPVPAAVIEGDREIVLTDDATLPMLVNGITLHLGPRSFFQTNTEVAAALYRTARSWAGGVAASRVWDLYCGVGGFALHLAAPGRWVTGIELSADAVRAAARGRDDAGLDRDRVTFAAGDATAYAATAGPEHRPHLVVVNPPRRGLGTELAGWLEGSEVPHVLYSSCNPETLARDLAAMPSLRPVRAQLFDMFPQTAHAEVLVLMSRD